MSREKRSALRGGSLAACLAALLLAGCPRPDPLAERRWELLSEEHSRLATSLGLQGSAVAPQSPRGDLPGLTQENERLRTQLQERERKRARAADQERRAAIEHEVEGIRGLSFKQPVVYQTLDRAGIQQVISGKLAEIFSADDFRHMGQALSRLGLLPENYPLREKYLALLSEQVAAFYDQHRHILFMFQDASLDSPQNQVILAHELTHALQDQHFGLGRLPLEIKNDDDRAAAASALVEGEATLVMSEFMVQHLSLAALKESAASTLTQNMRQLESAPPFLRETLVFPYLRGQEFCAALLSRGGYAAISTAYAHPPTATAQILHPDRYLTPDPEARPSFPWAETLARQTLPTANNVVGEFGMRILLSSHGANEASERIAAGWRGDRYLAFDEGRELVWQSVWKSPSLGAEFFRAECRLLEERYGPAHQLNTDEVEWNGPRFVRFGMKDSAVTLVDASPRERLETLWATVSAP